MAVLAVPFAVQALAQNGQAENIFALISSLPANQRAKVLVAPQAVGGLYANGQTDIDTLLNGLSADQVQKIEAADGFPNVLGGSSSNTQHVADLALIRAALSNQTPGTRR